MYYRAIAGDYSDTSEISAFCDVNRTRMEYVCGILKNNYNYPAPTLYGAEEFEKMIETEKPMTIDDEKCKQINCIKTPC